MTAIKRDLNQLRVAMGFARWENCSDEENKAYSEMLKKGEQLPDGIEQRIDGSGFKTDTFYSLKDTGLSDTEKQEYIMYKQLQNIKTIKGCVVFFTVLTVISLIATLLGYFR